MPPQTRYRPWPVHSVTVWLPFGSKKGISWGQDRLTAKLSVAIAEMERTCDRAGHVIELAGGPLRLQVVTDRSPLNDAVVAALAPGLLAVDRDEGRVPACDVDTVRVAVDPRLVRRLHVPVGPGPAILPDRRHAIATGSGLAEAIVCWHDDVPHVTRLLLADAGPAGQRTAVRTVRAVAERGLLAAQWVPLHAACAAVPGRAGVLLLGGRGAGKTTTLLHLLAARPPAALLANSALFLTERAEQFRARALPVSVALRPATVRAFPVLRTALAPLIGAAPPEHPGLQASSADERLLLSPGDLARRFVTTLVPEVDISAIVVVDHDDETAPEWHPATAAQARVMLAAAYPDPWLPDSVYETSRLAAAAELRSRHARLLDRLALSVPCAVLRPGTDPAGALQRGLDRLMG